MTGTVIRGDAGRKALFSTALRLLVYVLRVVYGREYEANYFASKTINLSRIDKYSLSKRGGILRNKKPAKRGCWLDRSLSNSLI